MKHTNAARTAAIAATLLAAGLAAAGPAAAAQSQSSTTQAQSASRITSQEQLRAGILHAAGIESTICSAGVTLGVHPMGGYPPPIGPIA